MLAICACVRPERLLDRAQQRFDRLLALLERMGRLQLLLAQVLVREFEEQLAVAAQRGTCQAVEGCREPLLGTLERLVAFLLEQFLGLESGACVFQLEADLLLGASGAQCHHQPAQCKADSGGEDEPDPRGLHHGCRRAPFSQARSSAGSRIMPSASQACG